MNALRGFIKPVSKKSSKHTAATAPVELVHTPPPQSVTPTSVRSALASPTSSEFPKSDAHRNGVDGSLAEIKADVMVNWLHHQQLQNMWSRRLPGEGVVLKKSRNNFSCAPDSLSMQSNFYDMIVAMNVRVCCLQSH